MLGTRIAAILRRNGWALNLVFIALGAYFVAGAFNAVLARSIRVVPTVDDAAGAARARPAVVSGSRELTRIAERNLFGVKRENLNPLPAASAAEQNVLSDKYTEDQLKACTLAANLRATLVAEGAPDWSMAVLVVNNEPAVFSINEGRNRIMDDAVLVDVRPRAVVVRRRDHYELCFSDEGAPMPSPMAMAPPPPTPGEEHPAGDAGVTKVSDTQYNIERGEVDKALGNLSEVATQARIVPSFKNGKANGFKLFSIKPGSIYSKIGLQNGDVIQKINGYEMNSPDKALEIYNKLRNESSVSLEIQRRGQPMTFNYAIGG